MDWIDPDRRANILSVFYASTGKLTYNKGEADHEPLFYQPIEILITFPKVFGSNRCVCQNEIKPPMISGVGLILNLFHFLLIWPTVCCSFGQ